MQDTIERTIDLKVPVSRVWRALTDYKEFGSWFRVNLESPFEVGKSTIGQVTYPNYSHLRLKASVTAIEPETRFVFEWCPYNIDPDDADPNEPPTEVEFVLQAIDGGTRLTVTESGFNALDPARREEAWRTNSGGWDEQMKNIANYVQS